MLSPETVAHLDRADQIQIAAPVVGDTIKVCMQSLHSREGFGLNWSLADFVEHCVDIGLIANDGFVLPQPPFLTSIIFRPGPILLRVLAGEKAWR